MLKVLPSQKEICDGRNESDPREWACIPEMKESILFGKYEQMKKKQMHVNVSRLVLKSGKILLEEGVISFIKRLVSFLGAFWAKHVFSYKTYYIYKKTLDSANEPEFRLKMQELTFRIIQSPTEVDELISEGFDFSCYPDMEQVRKGLLRGAVLFCIFVRRSLAHRSWVAMSSKAKMDSFPITIDYKNEAYIEMSVTLAKYRGLGLYPYALCQVTKFLKQKGKLIAIIGCEKVNLASKKGITKAGFVLCGEGCSLKLLFWNCWKEKPIFSILETKTNEIHGQNRRTVPRCYYDTKYWLTDNEGYEIFIKSFGREVSPRLKKSFDLGQVKSGMSVLDLGFGRGELLISCAFQGCKSVGIQPLNAGIEIAKEAINKLPADIRSRITIVEGDGCNLPFENRCFDRVFMIDVVEELYPEELEKCLFEVNRVLKDDGQLIVHTMPNRLRFDIGYRYWLRFVNRIANFFFRNYLPQPLPTTKTYPRRDTDQIMHVNEQSLFSLKKVLKDNRFHARVWLSDAYTVESRGGRTREDDIIKHILNMVYSALCPRVGPLKIIFADNLWAIAKPIRGR